MQVSAIRRVSNRIYIVEISGADGACVPFTFEVMPDPIPVVIWSDDFAERVGTLTTPGQEIAAEVLRFHELCDKEISVLG